MSKGFERNERIQFSRQDCALDTLAVRAGQWRTDEGEHGDPIFTTSSFVFSSAREAAARSVVRSQAIFIPVLLTRRCVLLNSVLPRWKAGSVLLLQPRVWRQS